MTCKTKEKIEDWLLSEKYGVLEPFPFIGDTDPLTPKFPNKDLDVFCFKCGQRCVFNMESDHSEGYDHKGCENLANAIIEASARDYIAVKRNINYPPRNFKPADINNAVSMANTLLRFFRSDCYSRLTNLDPEYLIKEMDKKALSKF